MCLSVILPSPHFFFFLNLRLDLLMLSGQPLNFRVQAICLHQSISTYQPHLAPFKFGRSIQNLVIKIRACFLRALNGKAVLSERYFLCKGDSICRLRCWCCQDKSVETTIIPVAFNKLQPSLSSFPTYSRVMSMISTIRKICFLSGKVREKVTFPVFIHKHFQGHEYYFQKSIIR